MFCKHFLLMIFFVIFITSIFVIFNEVSKEKAENLKRLFEETQMLNSGKHFIDTPGCRVPFLDLKLPETIYYSLRNKTCGKSLLITNVIDIENYSIVLNLTLEEYQEYFQDWDSINCFYHDFTNNLSNIKYFQFNLYQPIAVGYDLEFVHVECYDTYHQYKYTDYFYFPIEKHENNTANDDKTVEKPITDRLSVMVLGMDTLSRLNFLREMINTVNLVRHHFEYAEFLGQNKIGENTYPNLIALLTGLNVSELRDQCLPMSNSSFDNCSIIWKNYKEAGFKTAYAEDVANLALFNYLKAGFVKYPTDYYFYPYTKRLEKISKSSCANGRRADQILLEIIRNMIPLFLKHNFFSYFWEVSITHSENVRNPSLLDNGMTHLFTELYNSGVTNKTIIFLLSDHGIRGGQLYEYYRGRIEDRQPLFFVLYPKWFENKYPLAVQNLRNNSKKLTTVFDVYETLLDLVDASKLYDETIKKRTIDLIEMVNVSPKLPPRGISLFLPIPNTRDCKQAGIPMSYCNCVNMKLLTKPDDYVEGAAKFIIKYMNNLLKNYTNCENLRLKSINWGGTFKLNNTKYKDIVHYTINFDTFPGGGRFETTLGFHQKSSTYSTTGGEIQRVNRYGNAGSCIHNAELRPFCYCKQVITMNTQ